MSKKPARGIRNNNPGNIRISPILWKGEILVNTDGAFEQFGTLHEGVRALMVLLTGYMRRGYNTVEKIIHRYAPATENPTRKYIQYVSRAMGVEANTLLVPTRDILFRLVDAICIYENGADFIDEDTMERAWTLWRDGK